MKWADEYLNVAAERKRRFLENPTGTEKTETKATWLAGLLAMQMMLKMRFKKRVRCGLWKSS